MVMEVNGGVMMDNLPAASVVHRKIYQKQPKASRSGRNAKYSTRTTLTKP